MSFQRRLESSLVNVDGALYYDWIPAFAGMTLKGGVKSLKTLLKLA